MATFLNISTDSTLGGSSSSDVKVSSEKAIKGYVDGNVSSINTRLNKGNLGTTDLLTDASVLSHLEYYYNNEIGFGKNNFTIPSGSEVVVSKDGVVSNFSTSNYLYTNGTLPLSYDTFELYLGTYNFSAWENSDWMIENSKPLSGGGFMMRPVIGSGIVRFAIWLGTAGNWDIASSSGGNENHVNDLNKNIEFKLTFDGSQYVLYSNVEGVGWVTEVTVTSSTKIASGMYFYFGGIVNVDKHTTSLKGFRIYADNKLVFTGEQTGTATYTINNYNVNIPYKVTKMGRVVLSDYREALASVYSTYGYAPYFTWDKVNGNYTVPQGEI